jgi:hypothetical protein
MEQPATRQGGGSCDVPGERCNHPITCAQRGRIKAEMTMPTERALTAQDEELIERLGRARRIVREECGDIPQYVRTCLEAAIADAADRLKALAQPVVGVAGLIERQAVVAWLRHQSDLGANRGNDALEGSTKRAAFGGGSLALSRVADAIEEGEHRTNDNAALAASPSPVVPIDAREWVARNYPGSVDTAGADRLVAAFEAGRAASAPVVGDEGRRIARAFEIVRQVGSMEGRTDAQTYWFGKARDLMNDHDAILSSTPATEVDMRAVVEALGFDPTNHHNAAKCPYCTPATEVGKGQGHVE